MQPPRLSSPAEETVELRDGILSQRPHVTTAHDRTVHARGGRLGEITTEKLVLLYIRGELRQEHVCLCWSSEALCPKQSHHGWHHRKCCTRRHSSPLDPSRVGAYCGHDKGTNLLPLYVKFSYGYDLYASLCVVQALNRISVARNPADSNDHHMLTSRFATMVFPVPGGPYNSRCR